MAKKCKHGEKKIKGVCTKSIIELKMYNKSSGYIVEKRDPYYSNNFIVYPMGGIVFDRPPSKRAYSELEKILSV